MAILEKSSFLVLWEKLICDSLGLYLLYMLYLLSLKPQLTLSCNIENNKYNLYNLNNFR